MTFTWVRVRGSRNSRERVKRKGQERGSREKVKKVKREGQKRVSRERVKRWRTFVVICPRSVGSLTTSEDVFILRFHDVIINTQGRAQEDDWPARRTRALQGT